MHQLFISFLPPSEILHARSPLSLGQGDPLKVLIIALLSQATSDLNCQRAYQSLVETFPTWEELAGASEEEIAKAIVSGGLANNKAPRIKNILAEIKRREGSYSLWRLAEMDRAAAYSYLTSLPGVGLKTAGCTWAFGFEKPALPVDTHVARVAGRLGLSESKDPVKLQEILEENASEEIQKDLHVFLIEFGRQVCRKRDPRCEACPLRSECRYDRGDSGE